MGDRNRGRTFPKGWQRGWQSRRPPLEEARILQERIDAQVAANEQFQEIHDAGIDVQIQGGPNSIRDPLLDNPSHYFEENARRRARSSNQNAQLDAAQRPAKRGQPEDIFRIGAGRANHGQRLHQPTLTQLAIDRNILPLNHPNQEGRRRRSQAQLEAIRQRRPSFDDSNRQRNLGTNPAAQSLSLAERFRRGRPQDIERRVADALTQRHLRDVTGGPLDYTPPTPNYSPPTTNTPSSQATNPQNRRAGPGQPTPTPTPVTPLMNNDMDDVEGGGGNVEEVRQNGVNQGAPGNLQSGGGAPYNYIPRNIHQRKLNFKIQRTVRYDLPSRAETFFEVVSGAIYATQWNGLQATSLRNEWRFIPNQTYECYFTPKQTRDVMQAAGWRGSIRPLKTSIHVFNTRLAMQLPQEMGFLITVDKPYFKVYEDNDRQLFGHGTIGSTIAQIRPSLNLINNTTVHLDAPALTPVNYPDYIHTLEGTVGDNAINRLNTQLNLETSGGIEFYQPGDEFYKSWTIHADHTPLQNLNGDGETAQLELGLPNGTISGFIGYKLPTYNIANYSTDTNIALSSRPTGHGSDPNMVLITIPDITSINIGGGDFNITSELQMNVTYTMDVEVCRESDLSWNPSIDTDAFTGVTYLEAGATAYGVFRNRAQGVYGSTRPQAGAHTN